MPVRRALVVAVLLCAAARASAQDLKDRFNARVVLSGMYLTERQGEDDPVKRIAGPVSLGYGDLRLVLDARRLPGQLDIHVDTRFRLAARLDDEKLVSGESQTSARGYLGGWEVQITELWARGRWKKLDLGIGRLVVTEADALRLDGARVWIHAHPRWDVSLYAGGYPDPYSRSVTTDYLYGDTRGAGAAVVGGASARYGYDRIGGSFSANAAYLGGQDDGGPVDLNAVDSSGTQTGGGNLQREGVRAFLTWTNFWRPVKWVDFYHDLVFDVAGAAGVQLTRFDLSVAGHVHKDVTLRAGYDHMSALAIEMYLARLLTNRTDFLPGSIVNNLTISRTARDEVHLAVEARVRRTTIYAEGRYRRRVIANADNDPQFLVVTSPGPPPTYGGQVAPTWGWDTTLSVRDNGSLWALRPSLWLTYVDDYRTRNVYLGLGLGREFLRDRLSVDIGFTYASVREDGVDVAATQPCTASLSLTTCWGTRQGHNLQPWLTLAANPTRHWFAFLDYRAGVALTKGTPGVTTDGVPAVITHVLLVRVEARY